VIIRTGVRLADGGKVTKRIKTASSTILSKYDAAFRELAK
jgi:hypothetical protein